VGGCGRNGVVALATLTSESEGVTAIVVAVGSVLQPAFAEEGEGFYVYDANNLVVWTPDPCFHVLGGVEEDSGVFTDGSECFVVNV